MQLSWSPLHAALGMTAGQPFTLDLVHQAVEAKVRETATLEWKSEIPAAAAGDTGRAKIAKPIAAMANSGGGLIVYGVAEDDANSGAAQRITKVDTSEETVRRLLQIAGNLQPPVLGITPVQMPLDADSHQGVLALLVPPSAHAPHLMPQKDGAFKAPYRQGPQSGWMSEYQLEKAYAERFRQRASTSARVRALRDEVAARIDVSEAPWLVAVGSPETPTPMPGRITKADMQGILTSALTTIASRDYGGSGIIRSLAEVGGLRILPGLQRWIVPTTANPLYTGVSDWAHAEVFWDGTVILAVNTGTFQNPITVAGHHGVEREIVERLCVEFLTLVNSVVDHRGVPQQYNVEIDMIRGDDLPLACLPLNAIQAHRTGGYDGIPVTRFLAVHTTLTPREATVEHQAGELATDILNQFGLEYLSFLPGPA